MTAPQIPNLLHHRKPPSHQTPNPGSGSRTAHQKPSARASPRDAAVQATDQDASVSRLSAVEAGYMEDAFASLFVKSGTVAAAATTRRRFPIINRGTYIRTRAIDTLISHFLSARPRTKKQIISLGAGSDTRFFRLSSTFPSSLLPFIYHELDFPPLTARKIATITSSPALSALVQEPHTIPSSSTAFHSPHYHIHPIDLRTLASSPPPAPEHIFPDIDPLLPTLLISECCLVYLPPATADAVALYFAQTLFSPRTPLGMLLYEPIRPHDAFGQVMLGNLARRGIELQTIGKYDSLAAQAERMAAYGFGGGKAADGECARADDSPAEKSEKASEHTPTTMRSGGRGGGNGGGGGIGVADINTLWHDLVDENEKARVAGLEMVDEIEEWELLAAHYCVVWGWRDGLCDGGEGEGMWEGWKGVRGQDVHGQMKF